MSYGGDDSKAWPFGVPVKSKDNDSWVITTSRDTKIDPEMLKKFIGDFAGYEQRSISQRIKDLNDSIVRAKDEIERLEKAQQFIDALPFKEGDAAHHKDYGNVLVKMIRCDESNFEKTVYDIVSTKGQATVNYKELIPINNATKILYGKK